MDRDRLERLALFLALWDPLYTENAVDRPSPDLREGFTIRALLRAIQKYIGNGNSFQMRQALSIRFSRDPDFAARIDAIWRRYSEDRAFFARLNTTILYLRGVNH